MLLKIAEVFGHSVSDVSLLARKHRSGKHCPFRNATCNKGNLGNPLGICSFGTETQATVVCPSRFLEDGRLFRDAARLAFGPKAKVVAVPEVRILKVVQEGSADRKIGKIDFMLAEVDSKGTAKDFAALEVQSVYISGASVKPSFNHFIKTGKIDDHSARRPDFRSSAQKRLMPQLSLKVPIFRRWGKKFFVAVDSTFFKSIPPMKSVDGLDNSEVTWLAYPFIAQNESYPMGDPVVTYTQWDDVVAALREGTAPRPQEILEELDKNIQVGRFHKITL
jgi:hypothetical protein